MKIYLDIMYSDFWADPTHQNIPAAWAGQDLTQLTATVQSYTQQVISAFAQQGTPVDMVSIGNEIRNGILWPVGEINCTSCGGWDNLAQLLAAGVAGAKAGNPAGHKLRRLIPAAGMAAGECRCLALASGHARGAERPGFWFPRGHDRDRLLRDGAGVRAA
jgi:hypothetical protein